MAGVHKKIGMTVADAGVAHGQTLEPQFIDHAARGGTWRIFEDASGAFLAERLARTALFVADTNPLKNFFERFGGEFQNHREHHIIGRKRSVAELQRNFSAPKTFHLSAGRPVGVHTSATLPRVLAVA